MAAWRQLLWGGWTGVAVLGAAVLLLVLLEMLKRRPGHVDTPIIFPTCDMGDDEQELLFGSSMILGMCAHDSHSRHIFMQLSL
jgi:hypothetical protein